MSEKHLPPDTPPELRQLDDALRAAAKASMESPESQLSVGFRGRLRARVAARQSPGEKSPARFAPMFWATRIAAGLAIAAVGFGAYMATQRHPAGELRFRDGEQIATGSAVLEPGDALDASKSTLTAKLDGGRIIARFRDGSRARLESRDTVTLNSGEAWFDVEPNSGHFEVRTPKGVVTVVGTRFGVSLAGDSLSVQVSRGKVRVSAQGDDRLVPEGTQVVVRPGTGFSDLSSVSDWPAWVSTQLRREMFYPSTVPVTGE